MSNEMIARVIPHPEGYMLQRLLNFNWAQVHIFQVGLRFGRWFAQGTFQKSTGCKCGFKM